MNLIITARRFIFAAAIAFALCFTHAAIAEASPLDGARRVVFLGDSITYSGQYVDYVDASLRSRPVTNVVEILNLGLPSETVSGLSEPGHAGGKFPRPDLHERLDRVLEKTKPDVVIACYGMNDGIYYPLGEERFAKFRQGIVWMHDAVLKSGAKIIHVTPPVFDPLPIKNRTLPAGLDEYRKPFEGYNTVLDAYSSWLLAQRTNGWLVVDAHGPMNQILAHRRRENPQFAFSKDGVHADDTGHWVIASAIIKELHLPLLAENQQHAPFMKLIHDKNRLLSNAWLTDTGHKRPGMEKGLPVPEAEDKTDELSRQITAMSGSPRN